MPLGARRQREVNRVEDDKRQWLTAEQATGILQSLRGKQCFVCGASKWEVNHYLAEMRLFRRGDISLQDGVYPVAVAHCATCGNTVLFNAIIRGIVQQDEVEGKYGKK
jgi:hypothetical protein